jgi:hypothetical protein
MEKETDRKGKETEERKGDRGKEGRQRKEDRVERKGDRDDEKRDEKVHVGKEAERMGESGQGKSGYEQSIDILYCTVCDLLRNELVRKT